MKLLLKLMAWMLSNLALIGLVLAACYAFVYWDDPFGRETPAGKLMAWFTQGADDDIALQQQADEPRIEAADIELIPAVSDGAEDDARTEEAMQGVASQSAAAAPQSSELDTALSQVVEDALPDDMQTAGSLTVSTPEADALALEEDAVDSARRMIIDARLAFHRGDQDAAIASYEALIEQQQDHFDALGELGNIYYLQRDWKRAADAWYRAALAMLDQGDRMRAGEMVSLLRPIDGQKAYELDRQLQTSDAASQGSMR